MRLFNSTPKNRTHKTLRAKPHPSARKIADIIKTWKWPNGAGKTALEAVNASLRNCDQWFAKLQQVELPNPRMERFRHYVLGALPSPSVLVLGHFDGLFRNKIRYGFGSSLMGYVWTPKQLDSIGSSLAWDWGGAPKLWVALVGMMDEGD